MTWWSYLSRLGGTCKMTARSCEDSVSVSGGGVRLQQHARIANLPNQHQATHAKLHAAIQLPSACLYRSLPSLRPAAPQLRSLATWALAAGSVEDCTLLQHQVEELKLRGSPERSAPTRAHPPKRTLTHAMSDCQTVLLFPPLSRAGC